MTIIFESHSTSVDNELGIASGHLNSPLSEKGILQAQDLGTRYQDEAIEVVYCSDLIRSWETAKTAFVKKNIKIIEDSRLREWNYGKYNGALASEVEKLKKHYIHQPFPDGESLMMALNRMDGLLDTICDRMTFKKPVLIIGHRAVFYALEHRFNNCPLEELVARTWSWQPGLRYYETVLMPPH